MVILSSLLARGPNSPFYQCLIAPNIGSDYSPGMGWVTEYENYILIDLISVSKIDFCFLGHSSNLNWEKDTKQEAFLDIQRQMVNTIPP